MLRRNVTANRLPGPIDVVEMDLRDPLPDTLRGAFDLVAANPPYEPLGDGRVSPAPLRAASRHEIRGGLAEFLAAARAMLTMHGTLSMIYRYRRRAHAKAVLATMGFRIVRERLHRATPVSEPSTFCVEAGIAMPEGPAPSDRGCVVEDLVMHGSGRKYSDTVERFLDGDYSSAS